MQPHSWGRRSLSLKLVDARFAMVVVDLDRRKVSEGPSLNLNFLHYSRSCCYPNLRLKIPFLIFFFLLFLKNQFEFSRLYQKNLLEFQFYLSFILNSYLYL